METTLERRRSKSLQDVLPGMVTLFSHLSYPVGVLDNTGRCVMLNKAGHEFLGVRDVSEIGLNLWGCRLRSEAARFFAGKGTGDIEYLVDDRCGNAYQSKSSPIYDESGKCLGKIESLFNVTTLYDSDERLRVMIDEAPLCCNFWNEMFENIDCNRAAAELFDLPDRQTYLNSFFDLSPEMQPNGKKSSDEAFRHITRAFRDGYDRFEWMHQKLNGDPIPAEVTLVRVKYRKGNIVLGYTRDLRSSRSVSEVNDLDWLMQVLRGLPFPTGVSNPAGKWVFLNQAALDFFRVIDIDQLNNDVSATWGGRLIALCNSMGTTEKGTGVYYNDQQTGKIYQRYSSPLKDDFGGVVGRIEAIQDVTTLYEADERVRAMVDAAPLCCNFWNDKFENVDCNLEAAKLFNLPDKETYLERFFDLSPEFQPTGERSVVAAMRHITRAFTEGFDRFEWLHQKLNGDPIPAEITLVRVKHRKGNIVLGYTRDKRPVGLSKS